MLKTKLFSSFLIASIILTAFLMLSTKQVNADVIFMDGYESGDFSAWDGTVLRETTNLLYHREYIQISALPPSGAEVTLFGISNQDRSNRMGAVSVSNKSGNYQWILYYYDDGLIESVSSIVADLKVDTWYYVEVMVRSGAGNGQAALWVAENGTSVDQGSPTIVAINLNNNNVGIETVYFGGYVTGAVYSVDIFSDNVVASSSWVGPTTTVGTFSDGYESGDFSAWDGAEAGFGGVIDVSSTIIYEGTSAAHSYVSQIGSWAYIYYDFPFGIIDISSTEVYDGGFAARSSLGGKDPSYSFAYKNLSAVDVLYHREYIQISA